MNGQNLQNTMLYFIDLDEYMKEKPKLHVFVEFWRGRKIHFSDLMP